MQPLEHDLETRLRLRVMDFLRECKNGQIVMVVSPTDAPNDRSAGDVLSEEGGNVWAVVGK